MLTLSLILLINNSSTTRALSSHRSCFVSRVSSPPQNRALSSVSLSLLGDLGRRSTTNNLHRTFLSSDSNEEQKPRLTNIGKTEMAKILAEVENGTGDENYVVIDVRGADEIMMGTGLMSSDVNILPLPEITNVSSLCRCSSSCLFIVLSHTTFIYRCYLLTAAFANDTIHTRWMPSIWARKHLKHNSTFPNRTQRTLWSLRARPGPEVSRRHS
uniref:Rhodanese domain-containing protein n=1 Tax=Odontella aurita TaxID=265563 RepID=A0A7S4N6B8_9STRA